MYLFLYCVLCFFHLIVYVVTRYMYDAVRWEFVLSVRICPSVHAIIHFIVLTRV